MNHYLMIAGFFIIVTVAVASLEPFAPSLPSGPNNGAATGTNEQVADSGGKEIEYDESEDNSDVPTASAGQYDEAAQDRGK